MDIVVRRLISFALAGLLVVAVASGCSLLHLAARPGTFGRTGTMVVGRWGATATLLNDGRVLIAGGEREHAQGTTAAAELYDPQSGSFVETGSMSVPRVGHTATLLPDGRVLIAGGTELKPGKDTAFSTAELYDPQTGAFSLTGSMSARREDHTATLLLDGRVLIAGGQFDTAFDGLASAELFDPKTGEFTSTGSMSEAHYLHTASLLGDGRVLVAGGGGNPDHPDSLTSAEVYDPGTGMFSRTGTMNAPRERHTASVLADGTILLAGGDNNGGIIAAAELYDPAKGTFTATAPMTAARMFHTATVLPDGGVLIAGGRNFLPDGSDDQDLNTAELFDPSTRLFSATGSMTTYREFAVAVRLRDGRVLVAGGNDRTADIYVP